MPALSPPVCDFGFKAPDFTLPATDGRSYSLSDLAGESGLLLMFICNHCPFVKAITAPLVTEIKELQDLGIGVGAICSNDATAYPEDSFDKMAHYAETWQFTFPYLQDSTQAVAKAYGAVCTPDFFGFNKALELQYRGRFDNTGMGSLRDDRNPELLDAMRLVAASGKGPDDQTASIGCSIKWITA